VEFSKPTKVMRITSYSGGEDKDALVEAIRERYNIPDWRVEYSVLHPKPKVAGFLAKLSVSEEFNSEEFNLEDYLSKVTYENDIYDAHGNETYGTVRCKGPNGQTVGYIDYSLYDDYEIHTESGEPAEVIHIKMVETHRDARRKGIATKMLQKLKADNPGSLINWGGLTPDGGKFKKEFEKSASVEELPPAPGTKPIPPMTVRFYHYTKSYENLASIKAQGLLGSYGRGDGGTGAGEASAGIWASTYAPDNHHLFVEFYASVDQISHRAQYPEGRWDYDEAGEWKKLPITQAELDEWAAGNKHAIMATDIQPSQFLAIHEPWHHHARYMLNMSDHDWNEATWLHDPAEVEKLKTTYNSPNEAKALAYVQQVKGIT
jgi:ribosomal protein S18 acetylase RimI-like enzyme